MKKSLFLFFLLCLPLLAKAYDVEIDGIYYNVYPNAKYAEVTRGNENYEGDIVIPSKIKYDGVTYPVKKIGNEAFYYSLSLFRKGPTSVSMPSSITEIGENAFAYCDNLTELVIPSGVMKIGSWAFQSCNGLTKIKVPSTVVEVGLGIFSYCKNLTEVVIRSNIKEIESDMFSGCISLSTIVIPNGITKIGNFAFEGCVSLTEISIPNSVTRIDFKAFYGCSALKTITIGGGLKYIGNEAFANCQRLEDVYSYATTAPSKRLVLGFIEDVTTMFDGSNIKYATLHVLKSSMDSYKSTYPWSAFGSIVSIPQEYSLAYKVDGKAYKSYKIMQGTPITPIAEPTKEGYTFSGWSEIPDVMPDYDVTITGSFIPNKYMLTYVVDGIVYNTSEVTYGTQIPADSTPTKEGYTFVTNDEIPKKMPAYDVTITGSFVVNKYVVTYTLDGETYKTMEVEYGASIPQETEPTKEGYTFAGWSEIPDVMPAHDIAITGSFNVNSYTITYLLNGEVYKTESVEYGTEIVPVDVPQKEGYIFTGWNNAPETMPAHDIVVYGSYTVDTTGISDVEINEEGVYSIYTIDGMRINALQKGLNIIHTGDGKTKKIYVK